MTVLLESTVLVTPSGSVTVVARWWLAWIRGGGGFASATDFRDGDAVSLTWDSDPCENDFNDERSVQMTYRNWVEDAKNREPKTRELSQSEVPPELCPTRLAGYLPSELIVGDWLRARCVVQGQSWEWWSTDTGELLPKPWWGDARVIRLPPEVPVLAYAAHPALRGVELRSAGEAQGLAEHLAVREWEGGASASPRGWFVFQAARFEDGRLHPIDLLWAGATPSPLPWDVDERRDLLARLLAECPREVKKQVGSTLPMEPVAVATGAEPISELSIGDLIIDTDDALRYRVAQSQRHKPFSKAEWELMLSVEARAGGARRQRGGRGSPEEVWDLLAGHEVSRLSRLHGSVSLG